MLIGHEEAHSELINCDNFGQYVSVLRESNFQMFPQETDVAISIALPSDCDD